MIRGVEEPLTNLEKVSAEARAKSNLPVYQSLDLFIPKERPRIQQDGRIHYTITIVKRNKRKFTYTVDCHSSNRRIYHGIYQLIAIPEKLVLKMAKDIPKST